MNNATWLVESMCAHYSGFANHFEKRSEGQRLRLREDFDEANAYVLEIVQRAYKQARLAFTGNQAPPLRDDKREGVLDIADKLLRQTYSVTKVERPLSHYVRDPVYDTAQGVLKANKQRLKELFDALKVKHNKSGHQICRMAFGTMKDGKPRLHDELMTEYRALHQELFDEVYPVLAHFDNKPISEIARINA